MRLYTRGDTRFHPTRKAPKPPSTKTDVESQSKQLEAKRRSLCQKVDTTGVLTLFLGPPVLLLAVTFLVLFWWESMKAINGGDPEVYWFRIVDADWATRLITICTTAIRTVVSFQAGLATAMVAGVVLETEGIPLLQGPLYSILRAVKAAPSSLFTATDFRPHLPPFILTLVVAEVLVTAASQFLSTIYLSDFTSSTFTQSNNSTNVSLLDTEYNTASGWWTMRPAASWTFAELSEPFKEGSNFHDTGHTYRALLPFEGEEQRTKLRRYQGPAPVMDQRVICAAPPLLNMRLDATDQDEIRISGQIPMQNLSYPLSLGQDSYGPANFTCKLPSPLVWTIDTVGQSSMCIATQQRNWTVFSTEDPLVQPSGYATASVMYLVLDIVSVASVVRAGLQNVAARVAGNDGPWAIVTHGNDTRTLRASACLTNVAVQTIVVGLNSSSDNSEPTISWDRATNSYNTEAARRQLGASRTRESLASRGVLSLEPRSQWGTVLPLNDSASGDTDLPAFFLAVDVSLPTLMMSTTNYTYSPGVLLAEDGTGFYSGSAENTHIEMFQDTLNTTASPALAVQVVLARIFQMAYYEQLVKMAGTTTVSTGFSVSSSIPSQWTGFIIGTTLIATHVVIVTIITVQFARHTKSTIIGNYWQTVSQVVSNETRPILEQADTMDDAEVKRWAKRNLQNLKAHRAVRNQHDGRTTLDVVEVIRKS
ncbi:uncharacterized protein BO72DRAFT_446326 [Aspergillus fijiensis CBS 313.89]|uniref:Uncharacterized protein n=1 Tax=Aspergillus fijiensis CBS 313.89 TaxID=1448319 RepID=A0A8G1RVJ4_9EURO|nr:uncharacterized protein BO72DRAFT_446326 [Aspergillus fijiensis CBS 313.89]RAK79512.1 hypothetical protein BO72DRAFT_446326 [Aspergillus fijiensis CBS 313.89]